jgi:hypothetical protein
MPTGSEARRRKMSRVKALAGICLVCAVAFGAVAVQSAAGAGTTGFTCKEKKEPGGVGFSDAHCTTAVETGAKYEHVAIAENEKTEGRVTNEKTAEGTTARTVAKLKGKIAGVGVELQATETEGLATGANKLGAEHFIEGTGATEYRGVTVTLPAGRGCKVTGGTLTTNVLRGTSLGQGMEGKLEPASGVTFLTIPIEGCKENSPPAGEYPVSGSIKCPNNGATVVCTHAATTAQGTLTFGGNVAGVEVATTATARANSSQPWTPVAPTTVP